MSRRDNPVSTQGPAFFRVSSHCHPRSNHPQCSVVTIAEPQGCSARMLFRFVWLISRIRILLGPHQSFKKSREKPPHVASQSPTPHQRMGVFQRVTIDQAGRQVGDARDNGDTKATMPRRQHLRHRGHANRVSSQDSECSDLCRRLKTRPRAPAIHALGEIDA